MERLASPVELLTERLRLRAWREQDKPAFASMNADPRVMEYFPSLQTREQSDASVDRFMAHFAEHGWGLWALESREDGRFIGFTGLKHELDLPFSPCVEIGWRLAHAAWGRGFAPEAARAALAFAFDSLGLKEVVSFTALANARSRRVMRKIGMRDSGENFDHPRVHEGHALRRHCLYRVVRDDWLAQQRDRS